MRPETLEAISNNRDSVALDLSSARFIDEMVKQDLRLPKVMFSKFVAPMDNEDLAHVGEAAYKAGQHLLDQLYELQDKKNS